MSSSRAAASAARASSDSAGMVAFMCGSTTPCGSGMTGSFSVFISIVLSPRNPLPGSGYFDVQGFYPLPESRKLVAMLAGVDLGGTQVRVALARTDGRITGIAKTRTAAVGGPQGMAEWVAAQVDHLRGRAKVRRVAIGSPGPLDAVHGKLVNPANLPGWEGAPLAALVARATGAPTLDSLTSNVAREDHAKGSLLPTAALVECATGTPLATAAFERHLRERYLS